MCYEMHSQACVRTVSFYSSFKNKIPRVKVLEYMHECKVLEYIVKLQAPNS